MKKQSNSIIQMPLLQRFEEDEYYNHNLYAANIFPSINNTNKKIFSHIILNFSFRDINFNKKKTLSFFLALELLTQQKCVATLSSKNVLTWKLRKGMLVGCKVTLRKKNLYTFFDTLILGLPRMEKFLGLDLAKFCKASNLIYSLTLTELFFLYPLEVGPGMNFLCKKLNIYLLFKTFSLEEKFFFLTSKKILVH